MMLIKGVAVGPEIEHAVRLGQDVNRVHVKALSQLAMRVTDILSEKGLQLSEEEVQALFEPIPANPELDVMSN